MNPFSKLLALFKSKPKDSDALAAEAEANRLQDRNLRSTGF
jgi:hypothetical protein